MTLSKREVWQLLSSSADEGVAGGRVYTPKSIIERLKAAQPEQLEEWAVRLLNARSLDEVFS